MQVQRVQVSAQWSRSAQTPAVCWQPSRSIGPRQVVVRYRDRPDEASPGASQDPLNETGKVLDREQRLHAKEEVIRAQEERMAQQQADRLLTPPATQQPDVPHRHPTKPVQVPWYMPAFTRRREVFAGRLAMIGFVSACYWEWLFPGHPNIMAQVASAAQWVGLPLGPRAVGAALLILALHNAFAALIPGSPTWSPDNQADVVKRPSGPPAVPVSPLDWKQFFGATSWGFTKANEVLHGRLAMLGFTGVLVNQMLQGGYSGPGPLAQLAGLLGTPADDSFYASVPGLFIGWATVATVLAYFNNRPGSFTKDTNIY